MKTILVGDELNTKTLFHYDDGFITKNQFTYCETLVISSVILTTTKKNVNKTLHGIYLILMKSYQNREGSARR